MQNSNLNKETSLYTGKWLIKTSILPMFCLLSMQTAAAIELRDILKAPLLNDPSVLEAKATEDSAKSTTKATCVRHYPVLTLTDIQVLKQNNKYSGNDRENEIDVRGSMSLYSWGDIQATVRRNKNKEEYFKYKYFETQEQLGSETGRLYLNALRAKEMLLIDHKDLVRRNNLLKDLNAIVKYDSGCRSELIEARAYQLQVETAVLQQQRTMELALSRLSRYTGRKSNSSDLQDPSKSETASSLVKNYKSSDDKLSPFYLAQRAEQENVRGELIISKSERLPAFNLEGVAGKESKQFYVNMIWNVLGIAAHHNVQKNIYALVAAGAKLEQILHDSGEKAQTAEIDMIQSKRRANITVQHAGAQKDVVKTYELQFKVVRRVLTDVLGACNELSSVEQESVTAHNDFRDATLDYLVAQSQMTVWVGTKK